MTLPLVIGFMFLFLKTAVNYTDGFIAHYATFMASRSYLVIDPNQFNSADAGDSPAFNYAKDTVFKKYLINGLIQNYNGRLKVNSPETTSLKPFVGLYHEYTQRFSMGLIGGSDTVNFRSESFLGREPTRKEVYMQECAAISMITSEGCDVHATLDDNGG